MELMLNIPDSLLSDALKQAISENNQREPSPPVNEWMDKQSTAKYLNISRAKLDKLIKVDGLPCVALENGFYRISRHQVDEWLRSRATGTPSPNSLKLVK
ncbi:helix-turn-helix domain-containing protein [uncultured Limosilactobacillus sp.]|uniref:helix-turn-helix domain-containing protein n=1 Tax=uncultured Limosilactobacillus sp. TaxID=2837629 RepID=UPI0025E4BA9D|nr:helix-turn-helix domain-containing protein [uncultured Limosilactobacillus sp.]